MKALKITLVILLTLVVVATIYFVYGLYINPKSPQGSAEFKNENTEISIRYYRPYKNERLIFGDASEGALVPYGQYWRLGANLTTKITTNRDLNFAGRMLPAGSYGLYTYPYENNWVIFVHTKTGGFSFSEPDPSGIVMKINLPTQTLDDVVEQLTLDFIGSNLRIQWDTTKVVLPIE